MKPNGKVIYQGISLIDGAPIVAIAVGLKTGSTNRKTGNMVQTYILRSDVNPIEAIHAGKDVSICGLCPHRGASGDGKGRTCYVNIGQGPLAVYKAFKAGKYPVASGSAIEDLGVGRMVRLGTYGDPAAVPVHVWKELVRNATGHTGYTHQWDSKRLMPAMLDDLKRLCMASVDSASEADRAHAMGWRTFRVAIDKLEITKFEKESLCPASKEAGKLLTCETCLACSGADGKRGSIYIPAHGGTAVMSNVHKLQGVNV